MRWEVYAWAGLSLLLIAAETLIPGAFLMWLGFAAGVMFLLVLAVPGMSLLTQAVLFTALSFVFVFIYRKWFRDRDRVSDQPALNRRTAQLVGRQVVLERGIVQGRGRVQIADAYWDVTGPDLETGTTVVITGAEGMTLQVRPVE
ncbi:NfeD family protein [Luteimonas vadosa]|uniref:NfeD family protein n=1 Tax=Luteimonas vadosa TaxID=1165507 RepID=A0ABP9DUQ6_9GAMM